MKFEDFESLGEVVEGSVDVYRRTLDACEFVPRKDMRILYKRIRKITNRKFTELDYEYWHRTGKWLLLFLFCPRWKLKELRRRDKELKAAAQQPTDETPPPQPITLASHQITVTDPLPALEAPLGELAEEE
jgi:hypothetical protein